MKALCKIGVFWALCVLSWWAPFFVFILSLAMPVYVGVRYDTDEKRPWCVYLSGSDDLFVTIGMWSFIAMAMACFVLVVTGQDRGTGFIPYLK